MNKHDTIASAADSIRVNTPAAHMQRARGAARLSATYLDGRTRLARLYQQGSAKIRMPRSHHGSALDAVLINTSGGLTGGDQMDWTIDLGQNARAIVTTQACERIYRARADAACINTDITLAEGAALSWLPQETILFDGGAFARKLTVRLAPTASFLMVEPLIIGRTAMREIVSSGSIHDHWRIYRGAHLLHAEDTRLDGDMQSLLNRASTTAGAIALATIIVVHDDCDDMVEPLRQRLGANSGISCIHSSAGKRLVFRCIAESGFALRKEIVLVIDWCNSKIIGPGHGLPKLWNT